YAADFTDALKISGAGNWEPRFDHIYTEQFKLAGDYELLGRVQFTAWNLFSIAEGGVENLNLIGFHTRLCPG
ncbi:MAG: hypothetical protein ACI819_002865, partial [Neolewinella sp.]